MVGKKEDELLDVRPVEPPVRRQRELQPGLRPLHLDQSLLEAVQEQLEHGRIDGKPGRALHAGLLWLRVRIFFLITV